MTMNSQHQIKKGSHQCGDAITTVEKKYTADVGYDVSQFRIFPEIIICVQSNYELKGAIYGYDIRKRKMEMIDMPSKWANDNQTVTNVDW